MIMVQPKLLLFVALLIAAPRMDACSCVTLGDPNGVPAGDVLFLGTVVTTEMVVLDEGRTTFSASPDAQHKGAGYRLVVFRVIEKWKGDIAPLVVVVTRTGAGDCGYVFETGRNYLVDAEWTSDKALKAVAASERALATSLCSFTAPEAKSGELLAKLRKEFRAEVPIYFRWP
jgi:hypothetical protein